MHKLRLWNIIIGARHDVKFISKIMNFFKDNANFQIYLKMSLKTTPISSDKQKNIAKEI